MRWLSIVACWGCGRIAFDARATSESDATADTAVDAPEPSGLIAHYRMEDDPTDGVADATGRGHTGSCAPCPTLAPGKYDQAYDFDDTIVVVPHSPDLAPPGLTVMLWISPDTMGVGRRCVATKPLGGSTRNSWAICVEPDLALFFYSSRSGAGPDDSLFSQPAALALGEWRHVAVTWDGTMKTIWLAATPVATQLGSIAYDANAVVLGGDIDGGSPGFGLHGKVDELRIYERALTAAEIDSLAR